MPVSQNEEPGAVARHSSISSAGVPIKKRRFPLVWPSSPPLQEPNGSVGNRQSSPSQDSSLLNTSVVTSSPGQSDASKNHFPDVKKESSPDTNSTSVVSVQDNLNFSKTKLQGPNVTFDLSSMDTIDSKENVMSTKKSAQENILPRTELHLAPNKAFAVHVGKEGYNKQQVGCDFKVELSTISEDSVLSLGPKEPVPALADQKSEESHQMPDKLDSFSLSWSLSKEKCISPCESSDVNSRNDDPLVHSNRSNWDLNTTMDAWEGSFGGAAMPRTVVFSGLNQTGGTHDIKPSMDLLGAGDGRGKQILEAEEHGFNFPISSSSSQQYKYEDSLRLSLATSFSQSNFRGENSGLSAEIDSCNVLPNSNSLGVLISTGNMNAVGRTILKSEPCDESAKHDHVGAKGNPVGLSDSRTAKRDLVERRCVGAVNLSNKSPQIVVGPRSIKSEPVEEGNQQTCRTIEPMSQKLVGKIAQCQENASSVMVMPLQSQNSYPSVGLATHSNSSMNGDVSNVQRQDNASSNMAMRLQSLNSCPSVGFATHSKLSMSEDVSNLGHASIEIQKELPINTDIPRETCGNVDQVAADMVSKFMDQESKESNAYDGASKTCTIEDTKCNGPETCRLKVMGDTPQDSHGHGERSGSDDEKINISNDLLEEDSYGSDYESDANQALVAPNVTEQQRKHGKEEDEFEDGEVRDSLIHAATECSIGDQGEAKIVNIGKCNNKDSNSLGFPGDGNVAPAPTDEKDGEMEDRGEANDIHIKECIDTVLLKSDLTLDEDDYLQEPLPGKVVAAAADEKRPIEAAHAVYQSGRSDVKQGCNTEVASDGANNGGQGTEIMVDHASDENIKGTDSTERNDSTLPKTEEPLDVKDSTKDSNTGGNRSRIITLPRASNATFPYKARSFPDMSFGRERFAEFDGEKLHPRRNRDEIYIDGPRKFLRDRIQGQSFRNSSQSYGRGRGRVYGRSDSSRTEWDPDRIFAPRNYNGQDDFRFPRHKHNSGVGDEELDCNGYLMTPDGDLVGPGRGGGRKPISDEPSFRHPSSRRLSPGVRDGPATRPIQVLRRIPRNISPSRCTGEDGSDLVGLRHGEKFMRNNMPDDIRDPIFTRPQPPYGGMDGQFVRGNRNFSSNQRRGGPRAARSKSPIRSKTRSPGPWSSPRRRSPDGFNGVSEFTRRRSPVIYRMERIRSPDRVCFPDEIVGRRRGGSPSCMARTSNDLRDMDSGRVHGHMRSVIPNRSPSDRVLPRSNRRFDMLDPRERTENDEFGGPVRTGRFHELGGDGSGDDRRNFGERRGIVRPFRGSGVADGENFRCHIEDAPTRPFRLNPETDPEFIERSNLREREFERRGIKNRPVIAPPRRMRNIEEQDGNYRQGGPGQAWHDDGFDDGSRVKRRRF